MNLPSSVFASLVVAMFGLLGCTTPTVSTPPPPDVAAVTAVVHAIPDSERPRPAKKRAQPADPGQSGDFLIEMSRSGCYGRCPSYRVSLSGDGGVRFFGERFVGSLGQHQSQIDVDTVRTLQAQLRDAPFASLKGRYTPDDARCGLAVTDMASVTISISDGISSRQIEHYLGCSDAPASLYALARRIDEVTGSARWVSAPSQ